MLLLRLTVAAGPVVARTAALLQKGKGGGQGRANRYHQDRQLRFETEIWIRDWRLALPQSSTPIIVRVVNAVERRSAIITSDQARYTADVVVMGTSVARVPFAAGNYSILPSPRTTRLTYALRT